MKLNELRDDVGRWARRNFGAPSSGKAEHVVGYQSLLGLAEEIGEIAAAIIEMHSLTETDPEIVPLLPNPLDSLRDGVGDAMIYLCDYCSMRGIDMGDWPAPIDHGYMLDSSSAMLGVYRSLGQLMHYHLKEEQGIRHTPQECRDGAETAIQSLIETLGLLCACMQIDLMICTTAVWEAVSKRNWVDNPIDADKKAAQS
jgi:NTP pyrophosphatase (non-canonical NTP hydrolase)